MKLILIIPFFANICFGQIFEQTNSAADLSVEQLESKIKQAATEDEKSALIDNVIKSGREELFDKCLETNTLNLRMNQAIRDLPPSKVKIRVIIFILRASPSVWGDASPDEPENPMGGVVKASFADLCAETLKRELPQYDFDLHHKGVQGLFATRSSRDKLAAELESVLKH